MARHLSSISTSLYTLESHWFACRARRDHAAALRTRCLAEWKRRENANTFTQCDCILFSS
ncbi:hypothetical protein KIN20_013360 [Parelaphostrongylus tenuis]|uniref:Uncharacterized protein n=1 Tax=Parelaphostrongylus tenuis TaxID=148309 RepID=A0AAD5QNQ8_PARTN|nr:hypothetical protein KIN20_013360 [Parelaphostrongylus tenuis]